MPIRHYLCHWITAKVALCHTNILNFNILNNGSFFVYTILVNQFNNKELK